MLKVLIVDDEPLILDGLAHIVDWNELGLEIVGMCPNGVKAAELLNEMPVDIVITDIKMPDMDGIALVRHIKEAGLNCRCIVLSSHDDFQYVKEAALLGIENYLLKPVSTLELISTLENISAKIESEIYRRIEQNQEKDILRNNVVFRWLTDDIEAKELEKRAELLGIELHGESFAAAVIKMIRDDNSGSSRRIQDRKLLRFAAANICGELIAVQGKGITVSDMNGDLAILFSQETGALDLAVIRGILEQCVEQLNRLLGLDVFVTVGSLQSSYRNVHASYMHALSIQSFQLIYSSNEIVVYEDVLPLLSGNAALPNINHKRLREIVASRDVSAILPYYSELAAQFRSERNFTPAHVHHAVMELVFHVTAVIYELSNQPDRFFEDNRSLFQRVYLLDTIDAVIESLADITDRAIGYLEEREERISPFIRRVMSYAERNYSRNIDLKQVAHEYKVNAMYLGQCFKKETGETFTHYINRLRIDKAKQLLRDTNLRTIDIAEKVGYVNVNYFPTIFRKFVGKSPSDYQKDAADRRS